MATELTAAQLSGDQKAAILVLLLGEQVTAEMFKHLSRREVARIAREVSQLGAISDVLAQEVLNEYYLNAVRAPHEHGGPDAARRILARASISEEIADQLLGAEPGETQDLLGPLLEAPPDVLARALQDEHPQTAALVLLHLPPRRAAKLLRALPEPAQAETVLRMATLRQVRGAVLGEVAQSLQERLGSAKGQEAQGGLERTIKVLAAMARADTRRVLQELEPDHPDEVTLLRSELFTFDSLELADDRGMQELLRNVDSAKIALAITGVSEAVQARFLGNLSERAASMLKDEMEFLGTPNPDDVATARKEILDLALKLEADGSLTFGQPSLDDGEEHA